MSVVGPAPLLAAVIVQVTRLPTCTLALSTVSEVAMTAGAGAGAGVPSPPQPASSAGSASQAALLLMSWFGVAVGVSFVVPGCLS